MSGPGMIADIRLAALRVSQGDLTYVVEFDEVERVDPDDADADGSVKVVRSDGASIEGTYSVDGGVGSLRGGGWWDELENGTDLDDDVAGRALIVAQDKYFEEGDGPFPWNDLVREAAALQDW